MHLQGRQLCQNHICPLLKGVYSKRKEFASHWSKFFPFREDLFSVVILHKKANRKPQKFYTLYKVVENQPIVSSPLKAEINFDGLKTLHAVRDRYVILFNKSSPPFQE